MFPVWLRSSRHTRPMPGVWQYCEEAYDGVIMVPLRLQIPYSLSFPTGTQVTLSTTAPNEVDVWNSANPSQGDTPLLGGSAQTSQKTWTIGTDTIPTTLYVGATQGSASVGDIQFTLAISPPGQPTT